MNTLDPNDTYPFRSHRTMAEVMAAEAAGEAPRKLECGGDPIGAHYRISQYATEIPLVSLRLGGEESFQGDGLFSQFVRECLRPSEVSNLSATDAYDRYRRWCGDHRVHAGSSTAFGRLMAHHGQHKGRAKGSVVYLNLTLRMPVL